MIARHPRLGIAVVLATALAAPLPLRAQGTPLTVGPLTVNVPPGWTGPTGTSPVIIAAPRSNRQQFFLVQFFAPRDTPKAVNDVHTSLWGAIIARFRPIAPPDTGTQGQFIWTHADVSLPSGGTETFILYSAKSGNTYVSVGVDANSSELIAANLQTVQSMLSLAILGGAAPPLSVASAPPPGPAGFAAASGSGFANETTVGDYTFATPPGWTLTRYPDGTVLQSPVSSTGERCLITLQPMRAAGPDLLSDANAIFQNVFSTYQPRNETSRGGTLTPLVIRGASGQGWDYLMIKRGIGKPPDARGTYQTLLGFVFVAKLDNRLAVISGLGKDPLVSSCFGELAADAWPKFFYSLQFNAWRPPTAPSWPPPAMFGVWTIATATAADQFTFAANGRYGGASAAQNYNVVGMDLVTTTTAYFGDGTFTVQGNAITLTPDNKSKAPSNGWFRVEQISKDAGATWAPALYLLRTSTVDGKEYEVQYKKTR